MTDLSVVALGPGPAELLTLGALEAMRAAPALVLRTGVHRWRIICISRALPLPRWMICAKQRGL